jgi:hypothetical protein
VVRDGSLDAAYQQNWHPKVIDTSGSRANLQTALKRITSFDDNGMIAAADPSGKKPATCWMILTIKDGKYQRVQPTDKGFTCNPGDYYYVTPPKS